MGLIKSIIVICALLGSIFGTTSFVLGAPDMSYKGAPGKGGAYPLLVPFGNEPSVTITDSTKPIAEYIKTIYTYALSIVGILSTIVLMFAGFLWITAGGNASRVQDAKAWIGSALTGLVLALFSYTFLYLINPDLVNLRTVSVRSVVNDINDFRCCSALRGEIPAFYDDINKKLTCEPKEDLKAYFGNTTPLGPEQKCDKDKNKGIYISGEDVWCNWHLPAGSWQCTKMVKSLCNAEASGYNTNLSTVSFVICPNGCTPGEKGCK